MGSVIGPFVASDIFLGKMEDKISKEIWFPRLWARYMDDIFSIIKRDKLDFILDKLNSLYPSKIKFTHEKED